MISQDLIIQLISDYWPDEYLIAGQENVKNITEDVLAGSASEENFIVPPVGDNFDITFDLGTVLAAAQLIVAVYQVIQEKLQWKKQENNVINENEMKIIVENYANTANSKAWNILNNKQKVEFIVSLIKIQQGVKK